MALSKILVGAEPSRCVVVDDFYRPPATAELDAEALADFYRLLEENASDRERAAALVGMPADSAVDDILARVEGGIEVVWEAYQADPAAYPFLDRLIASVGAVRGADNYALSAIEEFAKERFGAAPQKFSNLDDAREALSTCALAFVDFRLHPGGTDAQALQMHHEHRTAYAAKMEVDGAQRPKVVYLISSSLPDKDKLQAFRRQTGMRSSFFRYLRKSEVNRDKLERELGDWDSKYEVSADLDRYLDDAGKAVAEVAATMGEVVADIELHDVAVLREMRLNVEGESVHSYLTWLLAESSAAMIRSHPGLTRLADADFERSAPLDGKLGIGARIFELFARASSSAVDASQPIGFGDVLHDTAPPPPPPAPGAATPSGPPEAGTGPEAGTETAVTQADTNAAATTDPTPEVATPEVATTDAVNAPAQLAVAPASNTVLMAISPACDLIRCSLDYPVLCVEGTIRELKGSFVSLLDPQALPLGEKAQVLKLEPAGEGAEPAYHVVEWDEKRLFTVPVSTLRPPRYRRIARVNELFAQGTKEAALSNASRVGLPAAPTIVVAAAVRVVLPFSRELAAHASFPTEAFEWAIVAKGRVSDVEKVDSRYVTLTEQFFERMLTDILPSWFAEHGAKHAKRLGVIEAELRALDSPRCKIAKGKCAVSDAVVLHYVEDLAQSGSETQGALNIYVSPKG